MITKEQIEEIKKLSRSGNEKHHEHDDCIRIAYEWLDAQKKTKGVMRKTIALKHIIERWGGRYVSQDDVEIAAKLHPNITGTYPHYNISANLTMPSFNRLKDIPEAETQMNYRKYIGDTKYKLSED